MNTLKYFQNVFKEECWETLLCIYEYSINGIQIQLFSDPSLLLNMRIHARTHTHTHTHTHKPVVEFVYYVFRLK